MIGGRKVRVVRPASGADVALALGLSIACVTLGLVSFTLLCWRVGSDLGTLPEFPALPKFFSHRSTWLFLAILSSLFAKLIDVFVATLETAASLKNKLSPADEISADELPSTALHRLLPASE